MPDSGSRILCMIGEMHALIMVAALFPQDREGLEFFEQKIRPVLVERCYGCHSARAEKVKSGFLLDTREGLLSGGDRGPAIVPGSPEKSLLVQAVRHAGEDLRMPPKKKLAPQEIADLEAWIRRGAPDPRSGAAGPKRSDPATFWSFQPLRRPEPPPVRDEAACRTPIDRFLQAKLEEKGLRPAPEADRLTLLRRVTFDLTGLPPTPEEIEGFAADGDLAKLVDRLLDSPRYGERWGRHWLDVVHYADTHGYDKDKRRPNAWPYRDRVIRALNGDLPWARFVREQLAGDVLFPGDPDALAATGFLAAGPWDFVGHMEVKEGTSDKEQVRLLDRDDMVASAASSFLSLTVHCARCHDHKFDPIPQRDYYALQAVFAGVDRGDRPWREKPEATAKRQALEAAKKAAAARLAELDTKKTPELRRLDEELKKLRAEQAAAKSPTNGWHSAISATPDVTKWVQVDLGESLPIETVRLVPARPTDFQDSPGFGFPLRFRVEVSDDPAFAARETLADHSATDFPNPGNTPFVVAGKMARYVRVTALRLWMRNNDWVFALAEVQAESGGRNLAAGAAVSSLDSIEAGRWSRRHLVDGFDSRKKIAGGEGLEKAEAARKALYESLVDAETRASHEKAASEAAAVEKELKALPAPDLVYAAVPRAPRTIHVLARGNVTAPREAAAPGGLSVVRGAEFRLDDPGAEGRRRAAFAEWVVHPGNALAWRSIVNRVWHHHFGKGLVDTPNDFGWNGGRPSHPELLDWLAVEFRDGGGSLKKLHRLILASAAYRRSSRTDPEAAKIDGDNRLLWRMNRRRLDAESVRDAILQASGALDLKMGGPGFDLFGFKDDHSPHYDYSTFDPAARPETWRRTVYRFTVRSVPNPFLESLDAADPSLSVPARHATNTALQALAMLNDPFVVTESERMAARLAKEGGEPADRAVRLLLGRPARPDEREALAAHAARRGWADACRVLLNANEFAFVD